MTYLSKYKKNIFIILFIVAAISFFSLADILVPKDIAAAEKQTGVTSKCHANMRCHESFFSGFCSLPYY